MRRRGGGDDERPAVEIWGIDPDPLPTRRVEIGQGRRNRIPVVAGVVAVAGLLAAGLVLGDTDDQPPADGERASPAQGSDDDGSAERDQRTTTSTSGTRRTTTTTAPTTTAPSGPVLWGPTGAGLLTSSSGSSWTWVDLDTGERREVDLDTADGWTVRPVRGGVVHIDDSYSGAVYQPLPDGEPVALGRASSVHPTEDLEAVWLVRWDERTGRSAIAQLVRLDGTPLGGEIELASSNVLGGTTAGVLFGAGGRAYQQDQRGVEAIGYGDIRDVQGTRVALVACDETATCRPEVIDLATGERTSYPPLRTADTYDSTVELVPAGGLVVGTFLAASPGVRAAFHAPSGAPLGEVVLPVRLDNAMTWLPDGGTALVRTDEGFARVGEVEGAVRSIALPRLDGVRGDWVVLVSR